MWGCWCHPTPHYVCLTGLRLSAAVLPCCGQVHATCPAWLPAFKKAGEPSGSNSPCGRCQKANYSLLSAPRTLERGSNVRTSSCSGHGTAPGLEFAIAVHTQRVTSSARTLGSHLPLGLVGYLSANAASSQSRDVASPASANAPG